jgi:predicted Zn-dependent peptidase
MFVMGAGVDNVLAAKALASAREVLQSLAATPVTAAELEQVKSAAMAAANKDLATPDGMARAWLDVDTYGLSSVAEQMRALNLVSPSDVQRAATRLLRDGAFASVVVGNAEAVKAQLERFTKVEIMGEIGPANESRSDAKPNPSVKPQIKSPTKPE